MESKKCPRCGNENIMNGNLVASYGFVFVPDAEKGLTKKSSYVVCSACKDCGYVFDLSLMDKPNKLTSR